MFEKIKEFFVEHSIKFLSLLCGCLIWFSVVSGEEARTEIELPVRVMHLQDNMALVNPLPPTLHAQLEGKAISLINLRLNHSARLEIDLKDMPLGHSRISSERVSLVSPSIPDIKMLHHSQTNLLKVELDARIEQKIPVQSKFHISAAPGFTLLGNPRLMPDSVYISGARSSIAKIKQIPTEEISITNLKWSNSLPVKLDLSSLNSTVSILDTSLFVQVQIEPLAHRIFSGIPVRLIGNFDREIYSLSPSRADVEITGGREMLSKIEPQDISLYIAFSRFSIEDSDELKPTVHIPHLINNWQILPEKFRLVEIAKNDSEDEL
jgi:YbbR domain-containing protein